MVISGVVVSVASLLIGYHKDQQRFQCAILFLLYSRRPLKVNAHRNTVKAHFGLVTCVIVQMLNKDNWDTMCLTGSLVL